MLEVVGYYLLGDNLIHSFIYLCNLLFIYAYIFATIFLLIQTVERYQVETSLVHLSVGIGCICGNLDVFAISRTIYVRGLCAHQCSSKILYIHVEEVLQILPPSTFNNIHQLAI